MDISEQKADALISEDFELQRISRNDYMSRSDLPRSRESRRSSSISKKFKNESVDLAHFTLQNDDSSKGGASSGLGIPRKAVVPLNKENGDYHKDKSITSESHLLSPFRDQYSRKRSVLKQLDLECQSIDNTKQSNADSILITKTQQTKEHNYVYEKRNWETNEDIIRSNHERSDYTDNHNSYLDLERDEDVEALKLQIECMKAEAESVNAFDYRTKSSDFDEMKIISTRLIREKGILHEKITKVKHSLYDISSRDKIQSVDIIRIIQFIEHSEREIQHEEIEAIHQDNNYQTLSHALIGFEVLRLIEVIKQYDEKLKDKSDLASKLEAEIEALKKSSSTNHSSNNTSEDYKQKCAELEQQLENLLSVNQKNLEALKFKRLGSDRMRARLDDLTIENIVCKMQIEALQSKPTESGDGDSGSPFQALMLENNKLKMRVQELSAQNLEQEKFAEVLGSKVNEMVAAISIYKRQEEEFEREKQISEELADSNRRLGEIISEIDERAKEVIVEVYQLLDEAYSSVDEKNPAFYDCELIRMSISKMHGVLENNEFQDLIDCEEYHIYQSEVFEEITKTNERYLGVASNHSKTSTNENKNTQERAIQVEEEIKGHSKPPLTPIMGPNGQKLNLMAMSPFDDASEFSSATKSKKGSPSPTQYNSGDKGSAILQRKIGELESLNKILQENVEELLKGKDNLRKEMDRLGGLLNQREHELERYQLEAADSNASSLNTGKNTLREDASLLREIIETKTNEVNRLTDEKEVLETNLRDITKQLSIAKSKNSKLIEESQTVIERLTSKDKDLERLANEVESLRETINFLESVNEQKVDQIQSLENTMENLRVEIADNAKFENLQKRIDGLIAENQLMESTSVTLQTQYDEVSSKLDKSKEIITNLQNEVLEKEKSIMQAKEACSELDNKTNEMILEREKNLLEIETLHKNTEEATIRINSLKQERAELENQVKNLLQENSELNENVFVLEQNLKQNLKQNAEEIENLRKDKEKFKLQIDQTASDRAEIIESHKTLQDEVASLKAQLEASETKLSSQETIYKQEMEELERSNEEELKSNQKRIDSLAKELAEKDEEIENIFNNNKEVVIQLKEELKNNDDLQSKIEELIIRIENKEKEYKRLHNQNIALEEIQQKNDDILSEKDDKIASLSKEIIQLQQDLEDANNLIDENSHIINDMAKDISDKDEEISNVVFENQERSQKLQEVQESLNQLKELHRTESEAQSLETNKLRIQISDLESRIEALLDSNKAFLEDKDQQIFNLQQENELLSRDISDEKDEIQKELKETHKQIEIIKNSHKKKECELEKTLQDLKQELNKERENHKNQSAKLHQMIEQNHLIEEENRSINEEKIEALNDRNNKQQEEIHKLNLSLNLKEKNIQELNKVNIALEEEIKRIRESQVSKDKDIEELKTKNLELAEKLRLVNEQSTELSLQNTELNDTLKNCRVLELKNKELVDEIERRNKEIINLQNMLTQLKDQLELSEINTYNVQGEQKIEELNDRIIDIEQENNVLENKVQTLHFKLKELQEIKEKYEESQDSKNEAVMLRSACDKLTAEKKLLDEKYHQCLTNLDNFESENESLQSKISTVIDTINNLRDEIKQLKQESKRNSVNLMDASMLSGAEVENDSKEKLEAEIKDLKFKIGQKTKEKDNLEIEYQELQKYIEKLIGNNNKISEEKNIQFSKLKKKLITLVTELVSAKKEILNLRIANDDFTSEYSSNLLKVKYLFISEAEIVPKGTLEKLRLRSKQRDSISTDLKLEGEKKSETIVSLKQENDRLKNELTAISNKYSSAKSQLEEIEELLFEKEACLKLKEKQCSELKACIGQANDSDSCKDCANRKNQLDQVKEQFYSFKAEYAEKENFFRTQSQEDKAIISQLENELEKDEERLQEYEKIIKIYEEEQERLEEEYTKLEKMNSSLRKALEETHLNRSSKKQISQTPDTYTRLQARIKALEQKVETMKLFQPSSIEENSHSSDMKTYDQLSREREESLELITQLTLKLHESDKIINDLKNEREGLEAELEDCRKMMEKMSEKLLLYKKGSTPSQELQSQIQALMEKYEYKRAQVSELKHILAEKESALKIQPKVQVDQSDPDDKINLVRSKITLLLTKMQKFIIDLEVIEQGGSNGKMTFLTFRKEHAILKEGYHNICKMFINDCIGLCHRTVKVFEALQNKIQEQRRNVHKEKH